MADFKIITDSSCDLSEEIIRDRDITVVPFYVMQGDGTYKKHGPEVTDEAFYEWMVTNPGLFPKSSAPSAEDYLSVFRDAVADGSKVICICITVKFSSSYQSASIAKSRLLDENPSAEVTVIDATVNTVLQGQIVWEACELRDAGVLYDAAVARINEIKATGRIFFTIGGIEYLRIGGRIGKLAGKVSSVLGIRPIITLSEGEIHPSGVCRGRAKSLDKVLSTARGYLSDFFSRPEELSITVGYGYDYEEAVIFRDRVKAMLTELGLAVDVPIYRIGAVIGVHTGPYPLGVGVVKRALRA